MTRQSPLKAAWEAFGDILGATPIHPQFFAKSYAKRAREAAITRATGIVADVGSGRAPYKQRIEAKSEMSKYITIDHPEATKYYSKEYPLDVKADISDKIPMKAKSVDTVLLLMVLEHVPQPSAAIAELNRILKPGGELILSTIQTHPVHDPPFDFYRYTRFGLKHLLESNGFELVELNWEGSSIQTAVTVLNTTLFQHLKKMSKVKILLPVALILGLVAWAIAIILNLLAWILSPLDTMHYLPHTVWAVARKE